jgi:hypothetical protein
MEYCGRQFSTPDVDLIRSLIAGGLNRYHLSRVFCEKTEWTKPDGGLNILLPPPQRPANNHLKKPKEIALPLPATTENVGTLALELVDRRTSTLWNAYIDRYHYLGYTPLPGAQLRYFVKADDEILGLLGFSAAAWKCAPRDTFIGWDATTRKKNLHLVVNNARFLILVKVKNLASRMLSLAAKRIVTDWRTRYGYAPVLLETFVDTERFTGTCYKAANWICAGATQGRGKLDIRHERKLPVKSVWLYPLDKDFRRCLNG